MKTQENQEIQEQQFDFSIFEKYSISEILKYYAEYQNKRYLESIEKSKEYFDSILEMIYKTVDIKEIEGGEVVDVQEEEEVSE